MKHSRRRTTTKKWIIMRRRRQRLQLKLWIIQWTVNGKLNDGREKIKIVRIHHPFRVPNKDNISSSVRQLIWKRWCIYLKETLVRCENTHSWATKKEQSTSLKTWNAGWFHSILLIHGTHSLSISIPSCPIHFLLIISSLEINFLFAPTLEEPERQSKKE